jgi:SAM-dependent methyltransferase
VTPLFESHQNTISRRSEPDLQTNAPPEDGRESTIHAPSQLLRDGLVQSQWAYIRALELLDEKTASTFVQRCTESAPTSAPRPLKPWPDLETRFYRAYQTQKETLRFRRILDAVLPGERVLDIGCGFGYLPGILLRDSELAHYFGVDVGERRIESCRAMIRANGLLEHPHHFEVRDIFKIDAELLSRANPDLIMIMEVLEHLRDPLRALKTVAQLAPSDADILFTVPFAGRLEATAGHYAFFDADRLQTLLKHLDLTVQYVEPLADTWTLVLASRLPRASRRIYSLVRNTARFSPPIDAAHLTFDSSTAKIASETAPPALGNFVPATFSADVEKHRGSWNLRTQSVAIDRQNNALVCRVVGGPDAGQGQYGGLRFAAIKPRCVLLEITFQNPENILAVCVDGNDRRRKRLARWQWRISPKQTLDGRPRFFIFQFGRDCGPFRWVADAAKGVISDIELFIRVRPETSAGFTLHHAEYAS